MVYILPVLRR